MSKMMQIRNVPEELHRLFKVRAAKAGISLSDYLLAELRRIAALPTIDEWFEQLDQRPPADLGESPTETIRRHRDAG